ncbi:DUF4192 family protein [Nesterenkonia ebinurensis]|uniref:DUF4192 family protein n=1 Tax=Nesterenkonia ebinurensis TaxID=2608252 RepID=UPI00123CCBCF|nr:DUF4192 family protein [Nesterenkonia ebinurensis]
MTTSSHIPQNHDLPPINHAAPLSINDPGDALALVQHTFGYLPQDSLVIIGLLDGRTGGNLRIDLEPVRRNPVQAGVRCAEWIAGAGAEPVPEAVLVAIMEDEPLSPEAPADHDQLLGTLADRLAELAGAQIAQVWYAAAGYVRDYDCHDEHCCPYPGTELHSAMAATWERLPVLLRTGELDPHEAVEEFLAVTPLVAEHRIREVQQQEACPPLTTSGALTVWEAALVRTEGASSAEWIHSETQRIPALLSSLDESWTPILLMLLTTRGAEFVLTAACPAEPDEQALREAIWGDSPLPPRWESVEALDSLLHELVPYASPRQREQLLGLKAWIEWIQGSGSRSAAFVEAVHREFPQRWRQAGYPVLAKTVEHYLQAVGVCSWARVKQSSYSWWKSRAINSSAEPGMD